MNTLGKWQTQLVLHLGSFRHTDKKDTEDDQDGTEGTAGRPGRTNVASAPGWLSPIGQEQLNPEVGQAQDESHERSQEMDIFQD